ncbi:TetR/AcrR family transcriptional regulator C-terminal domain-containing protein [Nocardia farcinica]|uniref:TetR/AcrR family transcriptional regulator C-terminal domain-containing protein n=1 Tax=Nocardia farcinica TaxID=37329 RepID=UPI0024567C89|nr:TetR/AcrR family transcriptional regulator C-terminal domain-containing protein [Nocardia farcinica]
MTKKQGDDRGADRLDVDRVVATALAVLDERGLAAVSTRAIAERLGVRMNTVLWHVKTKTGLLELMADAIVGEIGYDDLPTAAPERVRELARRLRAAMLAHRDGAALVVGTYAAEVNTLRFADAVVAALLDDGRTERGAAWTTWTIIYFTLGLTQEEQAVTGALPGRLAAAVSATTHPALHRVLPHLDAESFDERFEFGLTAILRGTTPGE